MIARHQSRGSPVAHSPDDMDLVFDSTQAFVRHRYPNRQLIQVDLLLDNGMRIRLPVPDLLCTELRKTLAQPCFAPSAAEPVYTASHSPDFRSVHWYGTDYTFTEKQSKVVQALWAAREEGNSDVGQDYLLRACDSDGVRLVDLFRRSPAWGTLIVSSRAGTYRLAEPPERP